MAKVRRSSASDLLKPNVRLVIVGCKETGSCGVLNWFKIDRDMTAEELLDSVKRSSKNEHTVKAVANLLGKFDITLDMMMDYDFWEEIKRLVDGGHSRTGYWQSEAFNKRYQGYSPFDNEMRDPVWRMQKPYDKTAYGDVEDYYEWIQDKMKNNPKRNKYFAQDKWSISATLLFDLEPDFVDL